MSPETQASKQKEKELKWTNPFSTLGYKFKLCTTKEEYNRCGTERQAKKCITLKPDGKKIPLPHTTILYSRYIADQSSIASSKKGNMEMGLEEFNTNCNSGEIKQECVIPFSNHSSFSNSPIKGSDRSISLDDASVAAWIQMSHPTLTQKKSFASNEANIKKCGKGNLF